MLKNKKNIFPIFDNLIKRDKKEALLNQKSKVIWLTGLSGSGKTTIALELEKMLFEKGIICKLLDGDNIRYGISNNLSFSKSDRLENIRRVAEVSRLFLDCGVVTINCFISPTEKIRNLAKKIIGKDDFLEIYVNSTLETCEKRDVKGLYKKARLGEIKNFTGLTSVYEPPTNPALELKTSNCTIKETVEQALSFVLPIIKY